MVTTSDNLELPEFERGRAIRAGLSEIDLLSPARLAPPPMLLGLE